MTFPSKSLQIPIKVRVTKLILSMNGWSFIWYDQDKKVTLSAEKIKIKKSNVELSDFCDIEQVTLKPQLEVHHYLTTWLQI